MTHRERLLTALRGDVPDQVPVTWELVGRFARELTGEQGWRAQCDAHRIVGSSIFNLQGVGPGVSAHLEDGYALTTREEPQPDGSALAVTTIATPGGALTQKVRRGYLPHDPTLGKRVESFVKTHADYDVFADYALECARTATIDASASREAQDYVGDDGLVGYWMGDAVYDLANARRDVDFIMDLATEPALMHRTLEAVDEGARLNVRAFNESAADVLVYDICWGTTSLLSPAMIDEFVIPRARWAVENTAPDKIIGFFTTGRIRDALPQLVDCGPGFIEHLAVLGDCDLAEVTRTFGDRVCLMGNYNPVVLARGTVDDARRETKRCLDAAMAGGGYAMTTSDEVPADARLDNMRAVVDYVAEHGLY